MRISLPEQAWIDLETASFGSRALAYIFDFIIRWTAVALIVLFLFWTGSFVVDGASSLGAVRDMLREFVSEGGAWNVFIATVILFIFLVEWCYPIYFEVRHAGVSPGKRIFGLRVVDEQGLPIGFRSSFMRTALLVVDILPGVGFVALVSMFLTGRSQRLGDLVAQTVVIYEPELDKTGLELDLVPDATELNQLLIPIEVYNVFESYMNRRDQIVGSAEEKAGLQLVDVLKRYIPEEEYKPLMHMRRNEWLTQLFKRVRPERRSFSGSRPKISYDQKLVYGELQDIYSGLRRLEQRSSDRTEKQLLELTEQWQRLCQRHAMFSTFFPEIAVTKKIAKLLHYGRRLLYGRRLTRAKLKRESFIRRCPAKFHLLKKHVAFSAVLFVSGGLLCSALVYINPELGWHFISEDVAAQLVQGNIWTEEIRGMSSIASSQIATNNIGVTFTAFALGITGGVGTIVLMLLNGALIGGIFVMLGRYEMAHRLLDFVVAHGVLELSIIVVAGGCGLYIGDSLINPGRRRRWDAVQQAARDSVDIILLSALCLIPAGIIEGYISPYDHYPFAVKLGLGLFAGISYWIYLFGGWRVLFTPAR